MNLPVNYYEINKIKYLIEYKTFKPTNSAIYNLEQIFNLTMLIATCDLLKNTNVRNSLLEFFKKIRD